MRELDIGTKRFTKVLVMDGPGAGGASHEYFICRVFTKERGPIDELGLIHFQNGPIKEAGVNGCHHEDLLAIVIDRLRSFQAGEYNCLANALAITKLEEAMHWLNHRTRDREARGVEGESKI